MSPAAPSPDRAEFCGINGVAQVVSRTVGDKSDQVSKVGDVARLLRHYLVENGADGAHHIDIFTLVMTADIVGLAALAFGRHFIQCTGMVLDIQPVTDLLPLPYTGSGLPARALRMVSGINFSGK